jgi:hypothetical protein
VKLFSRSPAVVRSWKRFIACGCSHGELADPTALEAVVKFREEYKPDKVIHTGDAFDTAQFRSGCEGTMDEILTVEDDVNAGCDFLERLQPTLFFVGNHEWRWYKDARKPNALVRHAARKTIEELREFLKVLRCDMVETYDWESWRMIGNYKIGHGISFNENAVRDHAERVGNCFIAHLHRQEVAHGRRDDRPVCVSMGYLGDAAKFTYADQWPGKMKWNTGWIWGEYCDDECLWNLHRHITPASKPKPYLPV